MKNNQILNKTKRVAKATVGLFICAFGVYLTVQANIGLAPWDVLAMGLARRVGMSYGDVATIIAVTVLLVDLALKERIGVGTILDAVIMGKGVDLYNALELVPKQNTLTGGLIVMGAGMIIMCFAIWIYMSSAICCGPRDSFFVALAKRLKRLPVGLVEILIQAVVLTAGWLLGGPVGIGTLMATFGLGAVMELVFRIARFEPRRVKHEDIITFFRRKSPENPQQCV